VLWYILIGSIVILPLTCIVSLGCKFMNVGFDQNNSQGLGVFKTSMYAEAQTGSNDLGKFLGCVNYSQFWEEQTNDIGFLTGRIAGGFLLGFTTLATIISICLQCFSKHGKSHLWNLMRVCYIIALCSQGIMYTIFASDMCKDLDGTQKCWPGRDGIAGVINFVLLFGMVITTCVSFPPRNPVYQCWGSQENCSESDECSTEEEDENMKESRSIGSGRGKYDDASSVGEAVSLFGGSRVSRMSKKSSLKKESRDQQSSVKSIMTEEEISVAEKGLLNVDAEESVSSIKSHKSYASQRSMSIPGVEKYLVTPSIANKSVSSSSTLSRRSVKSDKSVKSDTSQKSKAGSVVEPYLITEENSIAASESVVTPISYRSSKSNESQRSKMSFPGAKYLAKHLSTAKGSSDNVSISSEKSNRSSNSHRSSQSKTDAVNPTESVSSNLSNNTAEILNFMEQLVEMTEITEGGRRVKTDEQDRKIELVDEYSKKANGEIESNPSSDLVKIRTEYYDLGSRTVKEITHSDGSRTVITTIAINETMSTEKAEEVTGEVLCSSEGPKCEP